MKIELIQDVKSLCPECCLEEKVGRVPASILRRDNEIIMRKACSQHGVFEELLSPDANFYLEMERRSKHTRDIGIENPLTESHQNCPYDCGTCSDHKTPAMMFVMDLTNKCNLKCPFCFASSNDSTAFQLTFDQAKAMMQTGYNVKPFRAPCIQFSGGESTLHPDFFKIVREARNTGFTQINVATNGIAFANGAHGLTGRQFAEKANESGLNMLYLQFDGLSNEVYRQTRGVDLVDLKLQAIENAQSQGLRTILVPTIIRGINDNQIGQIYDFALKNAYAVSGISWQPVSFTGRIDSEKRRQQRYTLTDLALDTERQFPAITKNDWFPFSAVAPISSLVSFVKKRTAPEISCHPHCGIGTLLVIDSKTREYAPITRFLNVESLFDELSSVFDRHEKRRFLKRLRTSIDLFISGDQIESFYDQSKAPGKIPYKDFKKYLGTYFRRKEFSDNEQNRIARYSKQGRYLTIAGMHFMDPYNFETQRAQKCAVQYSAPDGKMYPFCTYNCGPNFRKRVEK